MTDDTTGGTKWELRQAGEQFIAAWRANDPDATAHALIRFSEGLRNSSLGVVGQVMAPVVKEQESQGRALDTVVTALQFIAASVAPIAGRLDTIDGRLGTIEDRVAHVETMAVQWGELSARVDKIDARHTELDDLQKWKEEVAVRLAGVEQIDRDALSVRIDRIEAILADLPTRAQQTDQRRADDG